MRYSLSCQLVAFVIFLWSCCLCTLYDNCLFDFAAGYCNKLQVDLKFQNQKKVFVLELVICQLIEAYDSLLGFYSSVLELTHYTVQTNFLLKGGYPIIFASNVFHNFDSEVYTKSATASKFVYF